MHTKIYNTAK